MTPLALQLLSGEVQGLLTLHCSSTPVPANPTIGGFTECDWWGYQPATMTRQASATPVDWCEAVWLQGWIGNVSGEVQEPAAIWLQAGVTAGPILLFAADLPYGVLSVIPVGGTSVFIPVSAMGGD